MLHVRNAATLDGGDFGWLKAKHHFKVTPDGNPDNGPLGSLIVLNDDEIAPGTGFGLHGHQNMEIISYVREGTVTHKDSTGNVGRTEAGDVQAMSAGTGIRHSEHNLGTVPLRLFQIWLQPREAGGDPRWGTRKFPKTDRANQFVVLASGFPEDGDALPIGAAARVLGATLLAGGRLEYELGTHRHAYLVPAKGLVSVNGKRLAAGDGVEATDEARLEIEADRDAEIILVVTA
jgi:quercetin 2,3-dioxygenase